MKATFPVGTQEGHEHDGEVLELGRTTIDRVSYTYLRTKPSDIKCPLCLSKMVELDTDGELSRVVEMTEKRMLVVPYAGVTMLKCTECLVEFTTGVSQ